MSDAHSDSHSEEHPHVNYIKIYVVLLVLLVISILGPEVAKFMPQGIGKWITLITAFGIAIVKAYMVCGYFMHMKFERTYITYLMLSGVLGLLVFFSGVAPDVMNTEGTNWVNTSAIEHSEKQMEMHEANEGHDDHHHGDHAHGDHEH